jgi:hypothetical protein
MSVIIINSFAHGGIGGSGPQRYWRVTFTATTSSNLDFHIGFIHGFEDYSRGFNNFAGASTTTNLTVSTNEQQPEGANFWPGRDYGGFFSTSNDRPNNVQFDFDLGVGNEAEINYIDLGVGINASTTPTAFTLSYSPDDITYFNYWSSGALAAWTGWPSVGDEQAIGRIDQVDLSEGVKANHSKTYIVSGVASTGQTVQHSKTFVVSGKRADGLAVTEATTYVVVTP